MDTFPQGQLRGERKVGTQGLTLGQVAAGVLAGRRPGSAVFDNMACFFWLPVRSELTVLLTFSAFTFLWSLCLASIQSGFSLCFYFRCFFSFDLLNFIFPNFISMDLVFSSVKWE